jgi:hypothetical protein
MYVHSSISVDSVRCKPAISDPIIAAIETARQPTIGMRRVPRCFIQQHIGPMVD